jgi:uncharacterized protein (DUF2345 family)
MLQAEDKRQQAAAELEVRKQELADARTNVVRAERHEANGKPQPATAEPVAHEQELANPRKRVERVEGGETGGHSLLKVGCAVAGLAGIGLVTAAMLGLTVDTQHVTTAGIIGAISAGGMFAVLWVAFVANWYRKRTMPVQEEAPAASNGSRPKPRASKGSPSKPAASKA